MNSRRKIVDFEINSTNDIKELKGNNVKPWQTKALDINSSDCLWHQNSLNNGNQEQHLNNIDDFNKYEEEYSLINFHFFVVQPVEKCDQCLDCGSLLYIGKSPEAQRLLSYYDSNDETLQWNNKITQQELDEIWELGLKDKNLLYPHFKQKPSLEEYNNLSYQHPCRWETEIKLAFLRIRCKLYQLDEFCHKCKGYGYLNDENGYKNKYPAILNLNILTIHKRYRSSKCFVLKDIREEDLNHIINYLYQLNTKNFERHVKLKNAIEQNN